MTIDRIVLAFAGTVILASLTLSQLLGPGWLWLTALVGANLLVLAFTGFCPLAIVLRRFGLTGSSAFR